MKSKSTARATSKQIKKKKRLSARKAILICVTVIVLIFLLGLAFNSMLMLTSDSYFMAFGRYRLFPAVDAGMDAEIPVGSLAVATRPTIPDAIRAKTDDTEGTIVVFRLTVGDERTTHIGRVVGVQNLPAGTQYSISMTGDTVATTTCTFADIIGVYSGTRVPVLGGLFEFLGSAWGLILLLILMALLPLAWWLWYYINRLTVRRKLERAALEKSAQALSNVGLRYDNIHEITAVLDVLSMLTETPQSKSESADITARLNAFIKAENFALPQTPETVAILDSLPAPDTPSSLAAALASGATLRQSEDGQTLILTTISGGKNIMLTPVQTADGVILCQQGMRLKADLAPNIEDIGFTSMPASPEFFEGLPLEKNVEYPELPQPAPVFGTAQISRGEPISGPAQIGSPEFRLSSPKPTGGAGYALLPEHVLSIAPAADAATPDVPDAPRMQTISQPVPRPTSSYGNVQGASRQTPSLQSRPYARDAAAFDNTLSGDRTPERPQQSKPQHKQQTPQRGYDAAAFDNAVTENAPNAARTQQQAERIDPAPAADAEHEKKAASKRQYRKGRAAAEIQLATELNALLDGVSPLTAEEQRRIDEYRASRKKTAKPIAEKPPETPEEKQAKEEKKRRSRQAAAIKKAEREAFLSTLSDEDREVYFADQKLKKSREAAVRKLKKMATDRALLEKIDND